MEIRNQRIFLKLKQAMLACLIASGCCGKLAMAADAESSKPESAEQGVTLVNPEVTRRQIDEDKIDTEDFEIGAFVGVLSIEDFGSNSVSGLRLTYHISEDFFLEAQYGASEAGTTSYEDISGGSQLLTDDQRKFTYYDLNIGYNLLPGEAFITDDLAVNTYFYLMLGAGNTDFADESHFTITYGVGYRVLVTDWLDLTATMRNRTFDSDLLGRSKSTNHLSYDFGFNIFF